MKIYALHPKYLDTHRLLRHHQSVHGVMQGIVGTISQAEARYRKHAGYVVLQHYLAVEEMRNRSVRHASWLDELWKAVPTTSRQIAYPITLAEVTHDIAALREQQDKQRLRGRTEVLTGMVLRSAAVMHQELLRIIQKWDRDGFPRDVFLI